jgi:hypothetical protein
VSILSLDAALPSRLLFIAAHEFGYILQEHLNLTVEDILVDKRIELGSQEAVAIATNEVAVELLLGRHDHFYYTPRSYTAVQLLEVVLDLECG